MWGNGVKNYFYGVFWFRLSSFFGKWFSWILPPGFRFYSK